MRILQRHLGGGGGGGGGVALHDVTGLDWVRYTGDVVGINAKIT